MDFRPLCYRNEQSEGCLIQIRCNCRTGCHIVLQISYHQHLKIICRQFIIQHAGQDAILSYKLAITSISKSSVVSLSFRLNCPSLQP